MAQVKGTTLQGDDTDIKVPTTPLTSDDARLSEEGKTYLKSKPDEKEPNTKLTLDDIGYHVGKRIITTLNKQGSNDSLLDGRMMYHGNEKNSIDNMSNIINVKGDWIEGIGFDRRGLANDYATGSSSTDDFCLSLGEADVINVPFQFNELDDVRSNLQYPYIGRLFAERIYTNNMPKVLFQVGQLKTRLSLFAFLNGLDASSNMSEYLRSGGANAIAFAAARVKLAFNAAIAFITRGILANKQLYSFKPCPRVYMRYVNEILQELAVYMDLAKSPIESSNYASGLDDPEPADDTDSTNGDMTNILSQKLTSSSYDEKDIMFDGFPKSHYMGKMRTLHIYTILPGYVRNYVTKKNGKIDFSNFGSAVMTGAKNAGDAVSDFLKDGFSEAIQINSQYIPFMLQRGVSVSESFSNSTGEHPLMGQINSVSLQSQQDEEAGDYKYIESGATAAQQLMAGDKMAALGEFGKRFGKDMLQKLGGKGGELGVALTGNARFNMPEVWQDSTFDRSYNLTFKFYSPYGDRLSIFENVYIPFIMLLCMALPRQIGASTYMSPFTIKGFAKGLFSCELGIISSFSVTKGEDANDRTFEGFPRSITVSMSIKDLAPKLMMGMDGGVFGILSAKNVGFRGYLQNMANIGIDDRITLQKRWSDAAKFLGGKYNWNNLGMYFRTAFASSAPMQVVASVSRKIFGVKSRAAENRSENSFY